MNIVKLQLAEKRFLNLYPEGFNDPEMVEIGKKHKMHLRVEFCQTNFAVEKFNKPREIVENMVKIISRSPIPT